MIADTWTMWSYTIQICFHFISQEKLTTNREGPSSQETDAQYERAVIMEHEPSLSLGPSELYFRLWSKCEDESLSGIIKQDVCEYFTGVIAGREHGLTKNKSCQLNLIFFC